MVGKLGKRQLMEVIQNEILENRHCLGTYLPT